MASEKDPAPESPFPDTPELHAVEESLQTLLQSMLSGPFTQRTLLRLEKTSRLARELLVACRDPRARRSARSMGSSIGGEEYDGPMAYPAMAPELLPLPGGMGAETLGVTIMRELITSAREWNRPKATVTDLITGISVARASGLPEVVAHLERELRAMVGSGAGSAGDSAVPALAAVLPSGLSSAAPSPSPLVTDASLATQAAEAAEAAE